MHKIDCVVFCFNIVFKEMFSLDKKFMLCRITLIPPKPISPLDKTVLTNKEQEVVDKFRIPEVISTNPVNDETTIL